VVIGDLGTGYSLACLYRAARTESRSLIHGEPA